MTLPVSVNKDWSNWYLSRDCRKMLEANTRARVYVQSIFAAIA